MRVALLSHNARRGDAIGNQVAEKLALFQERGAEVRIFLESLDRVHPEVRSLARIMRPEPEGEAWEYLVSADLLCFEFGQYYPLLGLLPLLAGGKPRILIDYHGITPLELWGPHGGEALDKGWQQRGLVWFADRTLVHSRFIERELAEEIGLPAERICRLGLPIDRRKFFPLSSCPGNVKGGMWRQRLGLEGAQVLLYVGRLAANKRVPLLVEALGLLAGLEPPVHLLLAGDHGDIFQAEAECCLARARALGVVGRLHFLGPLFDAELRDAYQAADLLVMPSSWESFCLPVIEAMACGVPVTAARAGALPETVGPAGLTFQPDDASGLARQIRRVLARGEGLGTRDERDERDKRERTKTHPSFRVAIVSFRYGEDFAGGAEWSLRRMAQALRQAGHVVEVFTTCNRAESNWANDLPAGTFQVDGLPVHRFPIDAHDRDRHLASVRAILEADGRVFPQEEQEYLRHALHSRALLATLRQRADEFDAVIVGPYLSGLTHDVASALPGKTLVVTCFHNEPMARLAVWRQTYAGAAGILYHSEEEQELAQTKMGLNHPGATVIGAWIDPKPLSQTKQEPCPGRYLVYCGRFSDQKNLPLLLDFANRYQEQRPGRFTFVFLGQGEVKVPRTGWARDLGFAGEEEKRRLLADAAALVQLSVNESLSLVALEAWSLATPVIASAFCPVLAGHLERSGGGVAVKDYASFARTLDDLWENPDDWQARGLRGLEYVREHYQSLEKYQERLETALSCLTVPLKERMRQRGLEWAALFDLEPWRRRFSKLVEEILDADPLPCLQQVEVQPRQESCRVSSRTGQVLISARIHNRGTQPLVQDGPGKTVLCCQVLDQDQHVASARQETFLPRMVLPGQVEPAAIAVPVPAVPGTYQVALWAESSARPEKEIPPFAGRFVLEVDGPGQGLPKTCSPFLESVRAVLAEASRCQRLPDDYVDVTEGRLARLKRWIKRKLLNNFKLAYVDVLSRQQSRVNQQLVTAVQELAESCATLDHAVRVLEDRLARLEDKQISAKFGQKPQLLRK